MNRKVYSKPSIDVVITTTTPLLAASGGQDDPSIKFGGQLDETNKFEDEPEPTEISGYKWYTAE